MRVVNLAHENDVFHILPYAYYCVARMANRRMLEHKEGNIDLQTRLTCNIGKHRLQRAIINWSYSFLFNFRPSPLCQSRGCAHAMSPYAEWRLLEAKMHLSSLTQYTRWHYLNVCPTCVAYCQLQHSNGRKEVWDNLPGFFGLRTWDELKLIQDA
jgi:hypothetical protein